MENFTRFHCRLYYDIVTLFAESSMTLCFLDSSLRINFVTWWSYIVCSEYMIHNSSRRDSVRLRPPVPLPGVPQGAAKDSPTRVSSSASLKPCTYMHTHSFHIHAVTHKQNQNFIASWSLECALPSCSIQLKRHMNLSICIHTHLCTRWIYSHFQTLRRYKTHTRE